mgnify:CR=1 FL=1|tara:strand:+ start:424 stop:1707 length:1284 start_codon:yes stop_codon:yes gene_type:complete
MSIDPRKSQLWANDYVSKTLIQIEPSMKMRIDSVERSMLKVLNAFKEERIGIEHFSSLTGYAHNDLGREAIDRVFARVLGAEKAMVRLQFVNGTHAIAATLFGSLRPGDCLLSLTGKPYDTLEEVIGIRGSGQGSLRDFGIRYKEINLLENEKVDFKSLENALLEPIKMVFIQRSCGYSWRESLSIENIKNVCSFVHQKQKDCICFVDNCYGEFVEDKEPCEIGADLIAGSLIKNLGGTIVPTGAYLAGRSELVEKASYRLTAPGIGLDSGTGFDLNRLVLQGLFLSPQMVAEALIGADLIAAVFSGLGFPVQPCPNANRSDVIQAVQFGDPELLKIVCKSFQKSSPIGSYLTPEAAKTPGYESKLLMAGGTFIDGSTSEFSADAPLRDPYNLFVQGGTHHSHIKIALVSALSDLVQAGCLNLSQTK